MVSKTGAFFGSTLAANYSWIGKRILVVVIVTPVGSNMRVFFCVRFLANSSTALPFYNTYRFSVCASSGQSQGVLNRSRCWSYYPYATRPSEVS